MRRNSIATNTDLINVPRFSGKYFLTNHLSLLKYRNGSFSVCLEDSHVFKNSFYYNSLIRAQAEFPHLPIDGNIALYRFD